MSRKFKKLTLQYSYLTLEKEEIYEACDIAEQEMRKYVKEHFLEDYKVFYGIGDDSEQENIKETNEKKDLSIPNDSDEEIKDISMETKNQSKSSEAKKLYRKIAELTHPDKIGNNTLSEVFSRASEAYSDNDIALLVEIALKLNIEIENISEESLSLIEKKITDIKEDLFHKTKTLSWAWSQTKSEEEKRTLIEKTLVRLKLNYE